MNNSFSYKVFEETIKNMEGKRVCVQIMTDTICLERVYDDFEFLRFTNGKIQFGFNDYDENNEYRRLLINQADIKHIYINDNMLELVDGIKILINQEV